MTRTGTSRQIRLSGASAWVLVAEPDAATRDFLRAVLEPLGCTVEAVPDARAARSRVLSAIRYHLVLSAPRLAEGDVLEILSALKAQTQGPPLVLLVERQEIPTMARLLRLGAAGCIGKPLVGEEVRAVVEHFLEFRRLQEQCRELRDALARQKRPVKLVAEDPAMLAVLEDARSLAASHSPILIEGDPGTGKRTLAQWIHAQSPRHRGPCVVIDPRRTRADVLWQRLLHGEAKGKSPPDAWAEADGGSLLVCHVEDLPGQLHTLLLRHIERRDSGGPQPDVRLILTLATRPPRAVQNGILRQDLYYALKGFCLRLPALRERPRDIVPLARHFLRQAAARLGVPPPHIERAAVTELLRHPWPNNLTELEQVSERLVSDAVEGRIAIGLLVQTLRAVSRAGAPPETMPLRDAMMEHEREVIMRALQLNNGNRSKTAKMLQINRTTLFSKLREHGLQGYARAEDEPDQN